MIKNQEDITYFIKKKQGAKTCALEKGDIYLQSLWGYRYLLYSISIN